ncbi:MAG: LPXTG cell wall anchor domain-containing protein, partial [Clostridia bacterium]|nr:LPXTG cell wall anchor domain-containing protein [Clostridia bacterium]
NDAGAEIYPANGGYAIIEAFEEEKPVDPEKPVVPGDASNMLVFAIIAVLAMAGSAVVVKTRR